MRRTSSGTSFPDPSVFARVFASASAAVSSSLVISGELEIAARGDGHLGPTMPQGEERGGADHRAVIGAEARTRHAKRMADAPCDGFAESEVRGDATAEENGFDR